MPKTKSSKRKPTCIQCWPHGIAIINEFRQSRGLISPEACTQLLEAGYKALTGQELPADAQPR